MYVVQCSFSKVSNVKVIFLICSQQVFLMWWNWVLFLSFKACDFLSNLCLQFCEHTDNINTQNLRLAVFPGQLEVKWQIFRNLQFFQEGRKPSFLNYSKTPSTFYFLNHMFINFLLNHQDLLKINCQCEWGERRVYPYFSAMIYYMNKWH